MDSQDVEELFMTCGPITITYTEHNQITDLQTETTNSPQHHESDDELIAIIVQGHEDNSKTQIMNLTFQSLEKSLVMIT